MPITKGRLHNEAFPACHEHEAKELKAAQSNAAGQVTVLLLHDEVKVRDVVAHRPKWSGCHAQAAGSGMEALAFAKAQPEPIDLLLSDAQMPGMDGDVAFENATLAQSTVVHTNSRKSRCQMENHPPQR